MSTNLLQHAAVDPEFREMLAASELAPEALPTPVDAVSLTGLDGWTAASIGRDIYAARATCTVGPMTFYCDTR